MPEKPAPRGVWERARRVSASTWSGRGVGHVAEGLLPRGGAREPAGGGAAEGGEGGERPAAFRVVKSPASEAPRSAWAVPVLMLAGAWLIRPDGDRARGGKAAPWVGE